MDHVAELTNDTFGGRSILLRIQRFKNPRFALCHRYTLFASHIIHRLYESAKLCRKIDFSLCRLRLSENFDEYHRKSFTSHGSLMRRAARDENQITGFDRDLLAAGRGLAAPLTRRCLLYTSPSPRD